MKARLLVPISESGDQIWEVVLAQPSDEPIPKGYEELEIVEPAKAPVGNILEKILGSATEQTQSASGDETLASRPEAGEG